MRLATRREREAIEAEVRRKREAEEKEARERQERLAKHERECRERRLAEKDRWASLYRLRLIPEFHM